MSKYYVGLDLTEFENNGLHKPVSRVTLLVDDENAYTAGDDTGLEIKTNCPFATQEMADAILAQLRGYRYQSYTAGAANIDPAAELGDGVTAGGIYSTLSQIDDDGDGFPNLAAPGEAELEEEFPMEGPKERLFNQKIAQTRSLIAKTAEQIRLEVASTLDDFEAGINIDLEGISQRVEKTEKGISDANSEIQTVKASVSTIDQKADTIALRVERTEQDIGDLDASIGDIRTQYAELEISLEGISAEVQGLDGQVGSLTLRADSFETSIRDLDGEVSTMSQTVGGWSFVTSEGETKIKGSVIETGSLVLSGTIEWGDLSAMAQEIILFQCGDDNPSYIHSTYISAVEIRSPTIRANEFTLNDGANDEAAIFTMEGASSYSGRALSIDSGAIALTAQYGAVYLEGGDGAAMTLTDSVACAAHVRPNSDADYDLGRSWAKWNDIYAANAAIQTSDRREKTNISYDMDWLDALFDNLKPCTFRFRDGSRTHMGMIAQDVEETLLQHNISTMSFAAFIKSPNEDDYIYGLRYAEMISLLVDQVQKLKSRVTALEGKVA